jgi:NADH dehydrogenase FAD-containing subunit
MSKSYSFQKCFDYAEFYEIFSNYLESSKNLELLRFYELAKDFHLLMNQTYKEQRAKAIVETFLNEGSPEQINISSSALKETQERYQKAKKGEILFDADIFEPSLKIVVHDLKYDGFYRFKLEKNFIQFMEYQKEKLGPQKFKECFLEDTTENVKESIVEEEITEEMDLGISNDVDPHQLLTVKIFFVEKDLKAAFSETQIKIENYAMNNMVMEMMKPFTGVTLSAPKVILQEKKSFSLFKTSSKKKFTLDENSIVRKFNKKDALAWIQNYFKIPKEQSTEKIFQMLLNYNVIEKMSDMEGFDVTDLYFFKLRKKAVVIGCGAAGITVANLLKEHMDVIVIDKKSEMTFINGFYFLFSNPMLIEGFEFPVDSMVKGCKFLKSPVKNISPSAVYLENEIIAYDYLIVASGSHHYVPYEITQKIFLPSYPGYKFDDTNDRLFEYNDIRVVIPYKKNSIISNYPFIKEAKRVIIVGSGSVGCETAGELSVKYPKMEIVMITQDTRLLQKYQSKKISTAAINTLQQYGNIKFNFGKVITRVEGRNVYFKNLTENVKVKNVEEFMEGDVLINCMGLRPNTKMFKTFMSDSLNAKGSVQVNEYFQVQYGKFVSGTKKQNLEEFLKKSSEIGYDSESDMEDNFQNELTDASQVNQILKKMNIQIATLRTDFGTEKVETGYDNIYAVGDIVDTNEEKLTFFAEQHGKRAAANILISERCSTYDEFEKKAQRYKGGGTIIQCVTLGKKGIVFKGHQYITHGNIAKFKADFNGKQLQNIKNISGATEKIKS